MRERLTRVFGRRPDPYAGLDLANASRIGGALWAVCALLAALLLAFVPPDEAIGGAGWAIAGVVVAISLAGGRRMRDAGADVDVGELFLFSFTATGGVAVLAWLSGGLDSPFAQLYVLAALYTCAVHPPRRALASLGVFAVLVLLPVAYDADLTRRAGIELATELLVWLALALTVMVTMDGVRAQRLGLRREGDDARHQARLDPLTGLLNRRAFDEDLERAIERARTTRDPLSVLVADLDEFKAFNDRYGHLEGDRVLRAVAEALRAVLRRQDAAYRWGGDEFALILPETEAGGARHVALRVRGVVGDSAGPDGARLALSTGVAALDPGADDDAKALVERADRALLSVKALSAP